MLEHATYNEAYMFDNFLIDLGLSEHEYIDAIKRCLKLRIILSKRRLTNIWKNSFFCHIPKMWNANKNAQFINIFKKILEKKIGYCANNLLSWKIFPKLATNVCTPTCVYCFVPSFLYKLRKNYIHQYFSQIWKSVYPKMTKKNSTRTKWFRRCVFTSINDFYLQQPSPIEQICLAKFALTCTRNGSKQKHGDVTFVIHFMRYSKHKDPNNFYQEKLILYVPYRLDESILGICILVGWIPILS